MVDIDKLVDYRREYESRLEKVKVAGQQLQACCPFHKDRDPSLSVDLKTGKFKCFACDAAGNFLDFRSRLEGKSTEEIYLAILDEHGMKEEPKPHGYTAIEYLSEKHLPREFEKELRLTHSKRKDGWGFLRIPYMDKDGRVVATRQRFPKGCPDRFRWQKGSDLILYGLWKLEEIKEEGSVILVEGESDTQALWAMGYKALGVPGASTFKTEWAKDLDGLRIYIHKEPDKGGETFIKTLTSRLKDSGLECYTFTVSELGVKDPSDLYIRDGAAAKKSIEKLIESAEFLDLKSIKPVIEDAPLHLREPEGFSYSDLGITAETNKEVETICATPIIITRRLRSISEPKERVELAFKRDGKWTKTVMDRAHAFQARYITNLADLGCTVTSENARKVVKFLQALEAANMDVLKTVRSTESMGWQTEREFLPFAADDIVLDMDPTMCKWTGAYERAGSLDEWVSLIEPLRKNDIFRFMLAGAFAAPLLRIVKQRVFFLYNWGQSRGGKTAAIKAALSVWGAPERMMTTFNATQVGLERMAGAFSDLPMGIDERQLAGSNQEQLEKIVYMLSSGQGKARGAKTGGIQNMNFWRSVILATGEEPIIGDTTQTGVSTRMIELEGVPFDDERLARDVHIKTQDNYGWAGAAYIKGIIKTGSDAIRDAYAKTLKGIEAEFPEASGSLITAIATITLADYLSENLFFKNKMADDSMEMAHRMMGQILDNQPADVNENAVNFIRDWITSNKASFEDGARERLGGAWGDKTIIIPSQLRKALKTEGYNPQKVMKHLKKNDYIETERETRNKNSVSRTSVLLKPSDELTYGRYIVATSKLTKADELPEGFEVVQDEMEF